MKALALFIIEKLQTGGISSRILICKSLLFVTFDPRIFLLKNYFDEIDVMNEKNQDHLTVAFRWIF